MLTSETKKRRNLIAVFCILSLISATIVMVLYHPLLRLSGSLKALETIITTTISSIIINMEEILRRKY